MKKVLPQEVIEEFSCFTELEAPKELSIEKIKDMYYKMNLIREFDTKVRDLWMDNKIYGLAHSYVGAEAIGVGACAALEPDDYITSTHRGHGHTISKGADVDKMMAELFGKYEGYNRGKGGSMHIADVEHGMLGATGIVGSGMPIAVGSAMAADVLGNKKVTILVDGFNVFEVYKAVKEAVDRARSGNGPTLIEARFMRLLGHFVADDQWYRDLKKVEPYWELDPLKWIREYLISSKLMSENEVAEIDQKAKKAIERSIEYATNECTEPGIETLYEDIYANGEVII